MARVTYLGLNMDALMVPRIVTACRLLYADIVSPTDSDSRVVQLVLHRFIADTLTEYARRTATQPVDVIVAQAAQQALAQREAAATQATTDAADILPTATT